VRVGVEEALAQHLPVEGLEQLLRGLAPGVALRCLAERHADHLVHHEQPSGGKPLVHPRHREPRVGEEDLAHPLDVRRLLAEVELAAERRGKVLDDGLDVDQAGERLAPLRLLREQPEQAEVALDLLRRARPLHLDHDPLAAVEPRAVHLADRSGGQRLGLDVLEDVLPRHAQLLLHHLDDLRLGQRRDAVLQARELGDDLGRDEVRPSREDLPELCERRTELLEGGAQPCGSAAATLEPVAQSVLRDDGRNARRSGSQVPTGELGHRFFHGRRNPSGCEVSTMMTVHRAL
jgi:hypothetical protein